MKSWIQLAQQQSKIFELAIPLTIGETYTISMNSNEPFIISVGDVFVGETVDGSLEFIATNSGDVMITSYGDISMEFEIKLELGSQTEWSPAPEDGYGLDLPNGAYHIQGGNSFAKTVEEGVQSSVHAYAWSDITLNGEPLPINATERYRGDSNKLEFAGTDLDFIAYDPVISTDSLIEYPAQSTEVSNVFNPISQVQVYWDDVSAFVAGEPDIGSTIVINTPWATQSSTDYIHSILNGYQYIPAQGTRVYADPAIQLGDTFTYGTINQLVASVVWHFDGAVTGNFDAPQNNDSNFDDPREILIANAFKKKVSLGDSYQGVTIDRENGINMLLSPDGREENAIGRFYVDINKGMAFQNRGNALEPWRDWLYFDLPSQTFKLSLYSTTEDVEHMIDDITLNRTWFAYSENEDGNPMTQTPTPQSRYMGTASEVERPTVPEGYEWVLIRGADGQEGQSLFIAYADSVTGVGFSLTDNQKDYFGLYVGYPPQSTTPSDYDWQPSGYGNSKKISELSLTVDEIKLSVTEINYGNIIPNFNMYDYIMTGWSGTGSLLYTADLKYYEGLTYGMVALPVKIEDAMSSFGLSFFGAGEMISPMGSRYPLDGYSWSGKVKNFKPFVIKVYEYNTNTGSSTKQTTFEFNEATPNDTYVLSMEPESTTEFFRISINVATATPSSRVLFYDMMFNGGAPKSWYESVEDVKIYAQSNIQILSNSIKSTVEEVKVIDGVVTRHSSEILQNAESISLKADKIDLVGLVSITDLSTDGSTVINGANITTGKIKAEYLDFNNATGTNVNLTGKITATSGKIGNFEIVDSGLSGPLGTIIKWGDHSITIEGSGSYGANEFIVDAKGINIKGYQYPGPDWAVQASLRLDGNEAFFSHRDFVNPDTGLGGDFKGIFGKLQWIEPNIKTGGIDSRIGATDNRYYNIYLNNQPNVASDTRYKNDIQDIDPFLLEMIAKYVIPKRYETQFDDKLHFGYIAQDVEMALYQYFYQSSVLNGVNKLEASRFANTQIAQFSFLSKSDSYMSLLYGEIAVIMDAYNRSRIDELEERLTKLEFML